MVFVIWYRLKYFEVVKIMKCERYFGSDANNQLEVDD